MKLYRSKIPAIAKHVVETLCQEGHIEVAPENRAEAEQDLASIMEEYLRRDTRLWDAVRDHMEKGSIGYENRGKVRNQLAEQWHHPVGDEVEKYLARQFIETFMISRFVDEVYAEDGALWRRIMDLIREHDVDERELQEEARKLIKNIEEGTVDFEIALQKAMRDVKKRRGLM